MTTHDLKTWPEFFHAVAEGRKTFEVRKNDRGFQTGDLLVLRRFEPKKGIYTGELLSVRVAYVLSGNGIEPGYVALGLGPPLPGRVDPDVLPERWTPAG